MKETKNDDIYFFKINIHHFRYDYKIGVKVGFVKADNLGEAENIVWNYFGTDSASGLEVWKTNNDKECFNVYFI